jgi:tetratricopeptide (TPR) repeat protein
MHSYGVNDVERLLNLSRGTIRRLVARGFVSPARGPRREYRFSFQDLIILRTARALSLANVPARRIGLSLDALRRRLPASVPLAGLSICAVGDQVVVRRGANRWHAESGQYLLELDVSVSGGSLEIVDVQSRARAGGSGRKPDRRAAESRSAERRSAERRPEQRSAELQPAELESAELAQEDPDELFEQALALEDRDARQALRVYERCCALSASHKGAHINRARLLHEAQRYQEAERVYLDALRNCGTDPTLLFNYGVLLEDLSRPEAAIEMYLQAITEDPDFADAHFNLARLYEMRGQAQHAIRHLGVYRKLVRADPH